MAIIEKNATEFGLTVDGDNNAALFNAAVNALDDADTNIVTVDEIYPISEALTFHTHNLTITGGGGFIATTDGLPMFDVTGCDNLAIDGITFDGDELARSGPFVRSCENATIKNCTIKKIGSATATGSKIGLAFLAVNTGLIDNNDIEDLHADEGTGETAGISLSHYHNVATTRIVVSNNRISNLTPLSESNGIIVFGNGDEEDCILSDNVITNCAKRGIKTQGKVSTFRNTITNSQVVPIDFQGYESAGNSSTDDTIVITDTSIDPLAGLSTWGSGGKITNLRIEHSGNPENNMAGIRVFAVTTDLTLHVDGAYMSGVKQPIIVTANVEWPNDGHLKPVSLLDVRNCEFANFHFPYAIQNGSFYSGGGPALPTIATVNFINNITTPQAGVTYLEAVLNYSVALYNVEYDKTLSGTRSATVGTLSVIDPEPEPEPTLTVDAHLTLKISMPKALQRSRRNVY